MARPMKEGIIYFPFDVDFFEDIKVKRIKKACGSQSVSILIYLLCIIYREGGYYIEWNSDLPFVISEALGHGVTEGAVNETVNKALQVGFFDNDKYEAQKILTSKGIQKRYLNVVKSSKLKRAPIESLFDLTAEEISSEFSAGNSEESTQRKEKQRKEKKLFSSDTEAYRLCELFRKCLDRNKPDRKQETESAVQKWCHEFDLMLRVDKREYSDIESLIKFTQWDSFEKTVVLSPRKLRERYDQLCMKRERAEERNGN